MFKKHKRNLLLLLSAALYIMVPVFSALMPTSQVSAASKHPYDIYTAEYRAFVGMKTIVKCVDQSPDFDNPWYEGRAKDESNETWGFSASTEVDTGFVSQMGGGDFQIDCNTKTDIEQAAKAVGFGSLGDLRNFLWPPLDKGGKSCDDDGKPNTNGNRLCAITTTRGDLTKLLEKFISSKDLAGPDKDASKLSGEAELWFWDTVYRKNVGDYGGCSGIFTSDAVKAQGYVTDRRFPENIGGASDPDIFTYTSPTTGKSALYKYALFNVPKDKTIESTGVELAEISGSRALNCADIAKKIGASPAAAAVGTALIDFYATCGDNCAPSTASLPSGSSEAGAAEQTKFQCSVSANPITWIMCALIEGFATAVDSLDAQVTNMLDIRSSQYLGDDTTGQSFKQVWSTTRTLSVGFLVIMALIMVISTAIGTGPFDAYTVKKVVPRIVVVSILISISWPLVKFMIDISSDLGLAVRGLIQAPFLESGAISFDGGQTTIGATALIGTGLFLGLPGLLSFIVTAFLAVMIAFLSLILRQILVILLAVIVPIALVSYVLPNTSKFGKFWWDAFSKALLVFPIISAFIAIGRVFAVVASDSGANGSNAGTIRGLIAFIAYFAPYFLIPQAFKMAGGLLGNLSGMVNDRGRGAFDRLKNFRQAQTKKNAAGIMGGSRFTGRMAGLNQPLQNAAIVGTGKAGLRPSRMAANLASTRTSSDINEIAHMMDDDEYKQIKGDDDLNAIAAEWTSSGSRDVRDLERRLNAAGYAGGNVAAQRQAAATAARVRKRMSDHGFEQMAVISAMAGGTHYNDQEAWAAAARATHGNQAALANVVAQGRNASMGAGRADVGGNGFGATLGYANRLGELDHQLHEGTIDQATYTQQVADARAEYQRGVLESQGPSVLTHSSMKAASVEELMPAMQARLTAALNSGDQNVIDRELATVAAIHDSLAATSPNKARVIADNLMLIPSGTGRMVHNANTNELEVESVLHLMDQRKGSAVYQSTHKEYQGLRDAQSKEVLAEAAARADAAARQAGKPGQGPQPPPIDPSAAGRL